MYDGVLNVTIGSINTKALVAEGNEVVSLARLVHPLLVIGVSSISEDESCTSVVSASLNGEHEVS